MLSDGKKKMNVRIETLITNPKKKWIILKFDIYRLFGTCAVISISVKVLASLIAGIICSSNSKDTYS